MKQSHRQTLTQALTLQLVKKMNVWDRRERKKKKKQHSTSSKPGKGEGGGFWEVWWVITFSFLPALPHLASHRGAWIPPRQTAPSCFQWFPLKFWQVSHTERYCQSCSCLQGLSPTWALFVCRWRMLHFETWGDNKTYSVKKNKQQHEPLHLWRHFHCGQFISFFYDLLFLVQCQNLYSCFILFKENKMLDCTSQKNWRWPFKKDSWLELLVLCLEVNLCRWTEGTLP